MRIDKAQVLDIMRGLGKDTSQAATELPDQVDTDEHSDLLGRYGISGSELLQHFGGGTMADADNQGAGASRGDSDHQVGETLPAGLGGLHGMGNGTMGR